MSGAAGETQWRDIVVRRDNNYGSDAGLRGIQPRHAAPDGSQPANRMILASMTGDLAGPGMMAFVCSAFQWSRRRFPFYLALTRPLAEGEEPAATARFQSVPAARRAKVIVTNAKCIPMAVVRS